MQLCSGDAAFLVLFILQFLIYLKKLTDFWLKTHRV